MHIKIINLSELPKLLQEIPLPPKCLNSKGNINLLKEIEKGKLIPITFVGSRKYSLYGKNVCEQLIHKLKNYNVCIISGLAIGIDSIAHKAALDNHIKTIAVLPSGLENLYPKTHTSLAESILKNDGLLLSEYANNDSPQKYFFPQRNRIMVGLSKLVIIIECELNSGTQITAKLATEFNRDLGVVPHQIFSETGKGANQLLKQGANAITSLNDILELLDIDIEDIKTNEGLDLTEQQKQILENIKDETTKEELLNKIKIEPFKLQVDLSVLELKGYIKESLGKIVKI